MPHASGRKPRVAVGHPYIGRGGSEAAVMWLIEALKDNHEVSVLTTGGWNLSELNAYYGTRVKAEEVRVRIAPVPWPARNLSVAALRGACFQRFAREVAAEYDLRISAYNPTNWGLPAVHLIADFSWFPEIRHRYDPPTPGAIYRESAVRRTYQHLVASVSELSAKNSLYSFLAGLRSLTAPGPSCACQARTWCEAILAEAAPGKALCIRRKSPCKGGIRSNAF